MELVEKAEQGEVVVLGGVGGQLDDRCRLVEHLAARSSTKWLCVATKAKAMEAECDSLFGE